MNRQIGKIVLLTVILLINWAVVKFGYELLSIPLWLIIIFITKFRSVELVSVLIVTEFFIGLDTFTIGPFSVIQILGLLLLLRSVRTIKKEAIVNPVFAVLTLLFFYFTYSYYTYYNGLTFAPINWIFIYLLTILAFKGIKSEFFFIGWLTVLSLTIIVLVNLIVHLSLGITAVRTYSFGNPNQVGFYSLFALIYIIFLYEAYEQKNAGFLKLFFYFHIVYIVFTGSRLNTLILLLFLLFLILKPLGQFWIKQKTLIFSMIMVIVVMALSGGVAEYIRKDSERKDWEYLNLSNIDDLNDPNLAAFTNARSRVYYDAIKAIRQNPVFGLGFLSWNDRSNSYNSLITGKTGTRISMHSTILQYWAETGLIGLMLYLLYLYRISHNGRVLIQNSKIDYSYSLGQIAIFIPIFMILGGTLDNHSLGYAQIHFVGAISVIMKAKLYKAHSNE